MLLLLTRLEALAVLVPYALVSRATQLGTGLFVDGGTLTTGDVGAVVAAALCLTAVVTAGTVAILDRLDIR